MNKKLILICDDDPEILNMITQALVMNANYEVIPFGLAKDVLDYLHNGNALPDLMILDLWLPDMDSDEMIPIIRHEENIKSIPIILISAIVNVEIVAKGLGVEESISKPFLIEELEHKTGLLLHSN